jgi:hypothetical protein
MSSGPDPFSAHVKEVLASWGHNIGLACYLLSHGPPYPSASCPPDHMDPQQDSGPPHHLPHGHLAPPPRGIVSVCGTFAILMRPNASIFSSDRYAARMRPMFAAPPITARDLRNLSLLVASEMFVHPLVSANLDATVLRAFLVQTQPPFTCRHGSSCVQYNEFKHVEVIDDFANDKRTGDPRA